MSKFENQIGKKEHTQNKRAASQWRWCISCCFCNQCTFYISALIKLILSGAEAEIRISTNSIVINNGMANNNLKPTCFVPLNKVVNNFHFCVADCKSGIFQIYSRFCSCQPCPNLKIKLVRKSIYKLSAQLPNDRGASAAASVISALSASLYWLCGSYPGQKRKSAYAPIQSSSVMELQIRIWSRPALFCWLKLLIIFISAL